MWALLCSRWGGLFLIRWAILYCHDIHTTPTETWIDEMVNCFYKIMKIEKKKNKRRNDKSEKYFLVRASNQSTALNICDYWYPLTYTHNMWIEDRCAVPLPHHRRYHACCDREKKAFCLRRQMFLTGRAPSPIPGSIVGNTKQSSWHCYPWDRCHRYLLRDWDWSSVCTFGLVWKKRWVSRWGVDLVRWGAP